jgi:hypothetical protein
MDKEFNYEEDSKIDPFNLHEECIRQPELVEKYSKLAAIAQKELSDAHEHVKVTRSDIIKEIKEKNPKITLPELEAKYRTDPEHIEAKEAYIRAEYNYNMIMAGVYKMQSRKASLDNLISLHAQQYYSVPNLPREFTDVVKSEKVRNKIRRSVNKRKS